MKPAEQRHGLRAVAVWAAASGMFVLLVSLGFWQLDRAGQKRGMEEAMEAARQAPPQRITAGTLDTLVDLPRFAPVELHGHYVPGRQVLLEAQSRGGRAGYRVWTPLALDERAWVVVDRGWVPDPGDRTILPDIEVDADRRGVTGYVRPLPRPGLRAGPADTEGEGWPRRLMWPEQADLERTWGRPVPDRIVLLHEDEPDGYVREWDPVAGIPPERHLAYAVQWFALALALAVIAAVVVIRNRRRDGGS